jgi:hypothetical protein
MKSRVSVIVFAALLLAMGEASAQQTLTPQDRAEIQELSARYAKALGGCAAEDYVELFVPETGYFASNIRGEVVGGERLMALVRSERHCIAPAAGGNAAAAARPTPTVVLESSSKGVTGRAELGAAGYYADEYVKTPKGWRIKARTVITGPEQKANLSVQDTIAIRRLAGTDLGLFDDMYVAGPDGVKRFRTSGVALGLSAEGVTGRALLKNDGGYYEDVYVRTLQGGWRFKSRQYVAAEAPAGDGAGRVPSAMSPGQIQASGQVQLTALDYFEIQQLVAKYAHAIDTCSNNGYDYADLFTPDGYFAPAQNGKVGTRFQGRERLAEVSGGGSRGCKNVGWIRQGVKHIYVNHIITPTATGATGTVDMLMIGLGGDPNKIRHEGYYEDTYTRTSNGWRFASRIHHVPEGGTVGR